MGSNQLDFRFWDSHPCFYASFLKVTATKRGMLLFMQQPGTNSPSSNPPSFAGLLASLTAPTPRTAWNNDDLAEDVATLSYEHALRAHARYKSADPEDPAFTLADGSGAPHTKESFKDGRVDVARLHRCGQRLDGMKTLNLSPHMTPSL